MRRTGFKQPLITIEVLVAPKYAEERRVFINIAIMPIVRGWLFLDDMLTKSMMKGVPFLYKTIGVEARFRWTLDDSNHVIISPVVQMTHNPFQRPFTFKYKEAYLGFTITST